MNRSYGKRINRENKEDSCVPIAMYIVFVLIFVTVFYILSIEKLMNKNIGNETYEFLVLSVIFSGIFSINRIFYYCTTCKETCKLDIVNKIELPIYIAMFIWGIVNTQKTKDDEISLWVGYYGFYIFFLTITLFCNCGNIEKQPLLQDETIISDSVV